MGAVELDQSTWLVTGANGTIGAALRVFLRSRVRHLVVADLSAPANVVDNETSVAFDLTDPASMNTVVPGCDGVVHLAGIPDEAPYEDLLRVNALGTYHLLEAMRAHDVRRLVYASSNRATGFHPTTDLLTEASVIRPDGLYGASKAAVEALTRLYADKFGFQVCNLRIGSYEQAPSTPREAATWLSPGDALRAFEAAMTTTQQFSSVYAVSANRHRFWSLEAGRRIGFVPQDDASRILGDDVTPPAESPQGGDLASPEYTLRHM